MTQLQPAGPQDSHPKKGWAFSSRNKCDRLSWSTCSAECRFQQAGLGLLLQSVMLVNDPKLLSVLVLCTAGRAWMQGRAALKPEPAILWVTKAAPKPLRMAALRATVHMATAEATCKQTVTPASPKRPLAFPLCVIDSLLYQGGL